MKSHSKVLFDLFTIFALLTSLFSSAVTFTPVRADSIIVVSTTADENNTGPSCSLREAITAANTNAAYGGCAAGSGSDTITVPAGMYTLTIAGTGEDANATGDLDITTPMTINGAGAGSTIIQAGPTAGSGIDRVFQLIGAIAVNVSGVSIMNGHAGIGGGIANSGSQLTVLNSVFSNNDATGSGAIDNDGGTTTIMNSTFSANSAGDVGGAIVNFGGTLIITNSTFSGNSALNGGGGIFNFGQLTVRNSTISGNSAATGGGIRSSSGTPTLLNTIIANNSSGGDCNGTLNANSSNLDSDGTCDNATQKTSIEINLGALADNGGPTPTFALLAGSLAIDAGDDAVCSASPVNNTSQNGVTRPQGLHCDVGSFEADITPPNVNSSLRVNPSPTFAASVDFTVTFSELVTGVDTGDFSLTTTGGVSGATVSGISGTGSTYTVTASTGKGSGTLRLDVVDNNSIVDGAGNPLGGVGMGDGNFATGEVYTVDKGGDTTGVFRPSNGVIFLKNTNTSGFADININYGMGGDYPIVGDWDGDGIDTIGIYRNGIFYLRNSNTVGFADIFFSFGTPGDQPIAGDWDGDGVDTVGVFHGANVTFYLRNQNTTGVPDTSFQLGLPGDVGIAGDWDGDGKDTTGVFRPSNGVIFLKNTNTTGFADVALNYGIGGDQPVTGDWNNDGIDTIGVFRNGQFFLRNSNTVGFADIVFALGFPTDMPIAGNWDGRP